MAIEPFSTGTLLNVLVNTHTQKGLSDYLENYTIPDSALSFSAAFQSLLEQHHLTKSQVIRDSGLDRTYAYQIINGTKAPGRDKILALSLSAGFTLKETCKLLEAAKAGILYSRSSRDAVIIYGIQHRLGVMKVNEMLSLINEIILE